MIVSLTELGAEKVKFLLDRDKREGFGLRMKVTGGGCAGLQYQMSFDNQTEAMDTEETSNGIRIIVDHKSAVYLVGTVIDYVDSLSGSGFKISNPNATNTCGCGESFGA